MFMLNCEGANSGNTSPACSLLSVGQVSLRPFFFFGSFCKWSNFSSDPATYMAAYD
jgi:hypothetical protein